MTRIKDLFMYLLALIVLLAPVIILGWIGLSLLGWPGMVLGIIIGLVIFVYSVNKVAGQEEAEAAELAPVEPEVPEAPALSAESERR